MTAEELNRVVERKMRSAEQRGMGRYLVAASTVSMVDTLGIESVDGEVGAVDLAA
jgi:hypothetical protein